MSDIEAIKDRIRKLMNYANDDSATDGEIENALGHAAKLIDKHHLNKDEFTQTENDEAAAREAKMGRHYGKTRSPKFHRWETDLANAVVELFGCVKVYLDGKEVPLLDENGAAQFYTGKYAHQQKMCRRMAFYGPDYEAQEAAELYADWCKLIVTMGVMRWGGAFRGNGEMYCQGFVDALYQKAKTLNAARRLTAAKPLTALPGADAAPGTAITLADRYTALQERATEYLETELHIKLGKGAGRSGSSTGSRSAYSEGRAHGDQAGFGRRDGGGPRKQLPGK